MRIQMVVAVFAAASALAAGPAAAQESRQGERPAARDARETVQTDRDRSDAQVIRVAYSDVPQRSRRCDNMLCPTFMVLGSGF